MTKYWYYLVCTVYISCRTDVSVPVQKSFFDIVPYIFHVYILIIIENQDFAKKGDFFISKLRLEHILACHPVIMTDIV